jgi:glucose/arabinose dehydrogenase
MSSAVRRSRRPGFAQILETLETRILFATLPANFTENIMGGAITNGTNMFFAPDGRLFVTQQTGQLRVVDHGVLQATPFTTVTTTSVGERGLLGIAFDPDYFNNHYVYVYYTALTPATHNRVSRFTADPNNPNVAIPGSETVLLDLNNLSTATNHNGGSIHFGPDGKLYIVAGENANRANAQSFGNLLGKMLRMNKDGTVPTDNPYFNDPNVSGQNKLIWSLGLRNPFTFAFKPGTSRMFINDVGESTWEEINDGIAHSNYGWGAGTPTIEGFIQGQTPPPDYRDPLFVYGHVNGQTAIIGGAFYNPNYPSYPASYTDKYFFADLGAGWVHTFDPSLGSSQTPGNFATGIIAPSSIQLGPDGSVYYLQRGGTQGAYRMKFLDTTAPNIVNGSSAFVFDEAKPTFGTAQRLRIAFNEYVGDSLTPSDLVLVNQTTGQTVPTANISLQYDASTNVATFSFPGFADANGVLPDGNYHATIAASAVTDVSGNALSSDMSLDFFALTGDLNRDRHVDAADQAILTAHLNQGGTYTQGDLNYDGTVNAADQAILTQNLALWLPAQGTTALLPATGGDDAYVLRSETSTLVDVFLNGSSTPAYRIFKGAPQFIEFDGGTGNDSLTLDQSNGTLLPPTAGINYDGGADNDTLTLIGTPASETYSFNPMLIIGNNDFSILNLESVRFDGAGGFDNILVGGGPMPLTFFNPQHFNSLSIDASSSVSAEAGGATLILTRSLSLNGTLNLNDNDLILEYSGTSPLPTIQGLINSARSNGTWTGTGLTSFSARDNPAHNTTLGAMESADYLSVYGLGATFDGEILDGSMVLVKYTYYGDADFNGKVNFDDYVRTDNGFNNHLSGWLNGDFDGNGQVNFDDYVLIDLAFNTQGAVLVRAPRRGAAAGSRARAVH